MKRSQQIVKTTSQAFDPTPYAVNGLSKSDVLEIKEAFDLLDTSASGKIDASCTHAAIKNSAI